MSSSGPWSDDAFSPGPSGPGPYCSPGRPGRGRGRRHARVDGRPRRRDAPPAAHHPRDARLRCPVRWALVGVPEHHHRPAAGQRHPVPGRPVPGDRWVLRHPPRRLLPEHDVRGRPRRLPGLPRRAPLRDRPHAGQAGVLLGLRRHLPGGLRRLPGPPRLALAVPRRRHGSLLGEARGKVVLIADNGGLPGLKWWDGGAIAIQDDWNALPNAKYPKIEAHFRKAVEQPGKLYINFVSTSASLPPRWNSDNLNPRVHGFLDGTANTWRGLGIVPMDFPNTRSGLVEALLRHN